MPAAADADVLAELRRGGVVESVHLGLAVAVAPDGRVVVAVGRAGAAVLGRSALKPLQAVALVRSGLVTDGAGLALACASHDGTAEHRGGVLRVLHAAGLDEGALQNTPDLPLGTEEAARWRSAGRAPDRLAQNCSGKHAAMLATCRTAGWDTASYLSPDHPLQRAVLGSVSQLTGDSPTTLTTDGCGTPLPSCSLLGLARAYGRLAAAPSGTPEGAVAAAVRAHPRLLGGDGRDVTRLVEGLPGVVAKDGAEGVYAAGLPDGSGCAVKVLDGSERPRAAVLAALLQRLGARATVLEELQDVPVLGHGRRVGSLELAPALA